VVYTLCYPSGKPLRVVYTSVLTPQGGLSGWFTQGYTSGGCPRVVIPGFIPQVGIPGWVIPGLYTQRGLSGWFIPCFIPIGETSQGRLFPVLYSGERSLRVGYSLFYTRDEGLSGWFIPVLYSGWRPLRVVYSWFIPREGGFPGWFIPCFIPSREASQGGLFSVLYPEGGSPRVVYSLSCTRKVYPGWYIPPICLPVYPGWYIRPVPLLPCTSWQCDRA